MRHAAPHQIANMEQSVHPAQIDEHAVVRNVFHVPVHDRAFRKRCCQRVPLGFLLFFEDRAPAHHHVPAFAVQLQDAHFDLAVLPSLEIVHRPQLDLRRRQKCPHADIDHQSALDPLQDFPVHVRVLAIRFLDPLPYAPPVRPHVR